MSKSLVGKQFGTHAAAYATSEVHAKGESLARLVELTRPQADWRALDVATGAGHMAAAFAPHVAHIIASDLTPEMLEQAARLAGSRGLSNVDTVPADAEALPFADESFDLVCCRLAAHHFPDVPSFVAEVARVLKPGGTFALVDNVSPDKTLLRSASGPELRDAGILYNAFEKLRDPSHGRALTEGEWVELVGDVGLDIAAREQIAKEMAFDPWVKRMGCDDDTIARLKAMIGDEGQASLKTFLRPRRREDDIWFSLQELILVARKPERA